LWNVQKKINPGSNGGILHGMRVDHPSQMQSNVISGACSYYFEPPFVGEELYAAMLKNTLRRKFSIDRRSLLHRAVRGLDVLDTASLRFNCAKRLNQVRMNSK
jgi:hypothetical protein